jgi:hypothetical protein
MNRSALVAVTTALIGGGGSSGIGQAQEVLVNLKQPRPGPG